jgi:5-methylcytosine-specific restriction endonuclease McrBC regulatory subunit McrC
MKETPLRVEFRKLLDSVLREGSYHDGHLMILEDISNRGRLELQETIKEALGISECYCD